MERGQRLVKSLSIRAPWAWCIMNAGKNIENRSQKTNYRGPLLIHVSKTWDEKDLEEAQKRTDLEIPAKGRLSLGACIGIVDLVDCYYSPEAYEQWGFADCYHLVIKNPRPICRFYYKGQLGLFDIPDDLIDLDAFKNPIIEECGYKGKGAPKGEWRVTVWRHKTKPNHYSYSCSIAGGLMQFECGSTTTGCYFRPEDALAEGIKSIYE
jgi:hypothetical protein